MQHPYVYGVLVFEAVATFVGQVSVLSLIAIFGAATTALVYKHFFDSVLKKLDVLKVKMYIWLLQVTTARKAVTLLLSYIIFTKPMSEQHAMGLILIAAGIMMKMLPDHKIPQKLRLPDAIVKQVKSYPRDEKNEEQDEEKRSLV